METALERISLVRQIHMLRGVGESRGEVYDGDERVRAGICADRRTKGSDYGAKTRESPHRMGKTKGQFQVSMCQGKKRDANQWTPKGERKSRKRNSSNKMKGITHKLRGCCCAAHRKFRPVGPVATTLFLSFRNCSVMVDFHPKASMVSWGARDPRR